MAQVQLPAGTLHYQDRGEGSPVVLVHGMLVNSELWRDVVPRLTERFRVLTPDLPFGSHTEAMRPDADLSPTGLATAVADFLAALDLTDVTLVGNDTGGAICQLVAAHHPQRLGRLALTNCDAYDNFFPPAFRYLQWLARIPGGVWAMAQTMRFGPARGLPIAYGGLVHHRAPREVEDRWCAPALRSAAVRRDTGKVLRGIHPRYTLDAIRLLRDSSLPVLLAWGDDDRFFPPDVASRLAADLRAARLERIPGSRTFVPLDAPERFAELLTAFVETAPTGRV
ncbi:MAG: alpha/beta hydrolase [Actinocatenispora sp.]